MQCSDVQDRLSAYYDDELTGSLNDEVAQHLGQCEPCALVVAVFEEVGQAIGELRQPDVPPTVWDGISADLDTARATGTARALGTARATESTVQQAPDAKRGRSWVGLQRLALAASILLLIGSGIWMSRDSWSSRAGDASHTAEFAMAMDHYFRTLPDDPEGAERFLLHKYEGRSVQPNAAIKLVGYRPAVADGLPAGYSLSSTSVLKMPCCTCVKAMCKRQDGSMLVLFEHDSEKTDWFGERTSNMRICGDKECRLVQLNSSIAATWKRGSRSVTAVGARDVSEVSMLVSWLGTTVDMTL